MIKLTDIDSSKTETLYMDGILWYSNPILETIVSSDGRMYNPYTNKYISKNKSGLFTVVLSNKYQTSSKYDNLLSRLLGIPLKKGESFVLIDPSLGYVVENLVTGTPVEYTSKEAILNKIHEMEMMITSLKSMVNQLTDN